MCMYACTPFPTPHLSNLTPQRKILSAQKSRQQNVQIIVKFHLNGKNTCISNENNGKAILNTAVRQISNKLRASFISFRCQMVDNNNSNKNNGQDRQLIVWHYKMLITRIRRVCQPKEGSKMS